VANGGSPEFVNGLVPRSATPTGRRPQQIRLSRNERKVIDQRTEKAQKKQQAFTPDALEAGETHAAKERRKERRPTGDDRRE